MSVEDPIIGKNQEEIDQNDQQVTTLKVVETEKYENLSVKSNDIGKLINSIISSTKTKGKSTIIIQIEISNE